MKKLVLFFIVAVIVAYTIIYINNRRVNITGEYQLEELSFHSPLSSSLADSSTPEGVKYIVGKNSFAITQGEKREWSNVTYKKEKVDRESFAVIYSSQLTDIYNEVFFAHINEGYKYSLYSEADEGIGYHIYQIGKEIYICQAFDDYQRAGYLTIEKVSKKIS